MTEKELKAMLASYARSVVGAAAALYAAGITDPKDLWAALVGAVLPVLFRAVNPNDPAFGRMPSTKLVDELMKNISLEKPKPKAKPKAKAKPKKKSA